MLQWPVHSTSAFVFSRSVLWNSYNTLRNGENTIIYPYISIIQIFSFFTSCIPVYFNKVHLRPNLSPTHLHIRILLHLKINVFDTLKKNTLGFVILVLCVNLAKSQYIAIQLNINPGVALTVFLWMLLNIFSQWISRRLPLILWVALVQSAKGLQSKSEACWKKEKFCLQPAALAPAGPFPSSWFLKIPVNNETSEWVLSFLCCSLCSRNIYTKYMKSSTVFLSFLEYFPVCLWF